MWITLIISTIIVFILFLVVGIYNRLVQLRNRVKNGWSQIDVQLQRRYDLIPNLIETVKGYMTFEKGTLEAVIQARNQAQLARSAIEKQGGPTAEGGSLKELIVAESTLSGSLGKIFALAESYPELRATENMQRLQEELSSTENKVAFSRQSYNDMVLEYNNAQQKIPAVFFASAFGHHPADLFEVQDVDAKKAVKVKF